MMSSKGIRISKYKFICCAVLVLLVLMDIEFFYLVGEKSRILGELWGASRKTLPVFIAFLLFFFTKGTRDTNRFMTTYLVGVCVSLAVVAYYSHSHYLLNPYFRIVLYTSCNLFVFLSFPLYRLAKKEGGYDDIFKYINIIFFVFHILLIAQSIAFHFGITFMNFGTVRMRNGGIRISMGSLGNIMIIYNYCKYFCNKTGDRKVFNLIQFLLGFICLIFIQQTRVAMIAVFVCIAIASIVSSNSPVKMYFLFVGIVALLAYLYYKGTITSFVGSFKKGSADYNSTISRFEGYIYFWKAFLKNPLCGHGIVTNVIYEKLIKGPKKLYFYSDVGIVGILAQYGIFALFMYVYPVLRWGRVIIKKFHSFVKNPLPLALFVYILITTPTLIVISTGLSLSWAILFVVFEFERQKEEVE